MIPNTFDIVNCGMECLTEKLWVVDAEYFIFTILREQFDYTKWQRQYYDSMKPGEFHKKALEYANEHPYKGKADLL